MAYDEKLADRIREYLVAVPGLNIEEKEMFRGITFMVNGKMCVCVSGDDLMVRFDPVLQDTFSEMNGFRTMLMKNREYKGYGYVSPDAIRSAKDFQFWIKQCLDFNPRAKASARKKKWVDEGCCNCELLKRHPSALRADMFPDILDLLGQKLYFFVVGMIKISLHHGLFCSQYLLYYITAIRGQV